MTHRRTRIRDAVVARLAAIPGLAATGSRVIDWAPAELPGASVYTREEESEPTTLGRTQERRLELLIDIQAVTAGDVDAALDAWCVAVEKAVAADWTLGRLALGGDLVRTTIGLNADSDRRVGLARLVYRIVYRTDPARPDN